MTPFLAAAGVAAAAVFIAEFGDKSQLLILAFATRYPAGPVIAGLVVAAAAMQGASVLLGAAVGAMIPGQLVALIAGAAFLAVALWTLIGNDDEDEDEDEALEAGRPRLGAVAIAMTVAATFVVGELGDKTMLVTFGLAATHGALATWIGSTIGEVAANLVAVAVGRQLGTRLSPRVVRLGSSALFAVGGIVVLLRALT